ncbi:MAG: hypothetical protein V7651_17100 [Hyphomonas oceanitis]|uniref:hypothetical protein n=1 Tax=Hyphomonas oceanitis TaxID=81033 RepID=UPI003001A55E
MKTTLAIITALTLTACSGAVTDPNEQTAWCVDGKLQQPLVVAKAINDEAAIMQTCIDEPTVTHCYKLPDIPEIAAVLETPRGSCIKEIWSAPESALSVNERPVKQAMVDYENTIWNYRLAINNSMEKF